MKCDGKFAGLLGAAIAATLVILMSLAGPTPAPTASAGTAMAQSNLFVEVQVLGGGALDVLGGLAVEIYDNDGELLVDPDCDQSPPAGGELSAADQTACLLPVGPTAYQLGLDGLPENATVESVSCFSNDVNELIEGGPEFSIVDDGIVVSCSIFVAVPTIFVDKVVDGNAAQEDFTIELFGGGGLIDSGADDDASECAGPAIDVDAFNGECLTFTPGDGVYQLGESAPMGYLPVSVWCVPTRLFAENGERFPAGVGEVTLGVDGPRYVYCQITNREFFGDVIVDKVVVNDDGGTASATDFSAEIFREMDGSAIDPPYACDANGRCAEVTVPIGEYRVGEVGPDGYDASVSCVVTREPDPPSIDTVVPTNVTPVIFEAIPGPDALFEVEPFGEVTCTITNDDTPATTTTTVPPTTQPPVATSPPPTPAPTPPPTPAAELPATGSNSSTGPVLALALGFLVMGGALVLVRRRA